MTKLFVKEEICDKGGRVIQQRLDQFVEEKLPIYDSGVADFFRVTGKSSKNQQWDPLLRHHNPTIIFHEILLLLLQL